MATLISTKCLSLVEQKRIQWAREREELAGLCAPWGPPSNRRDENYRACIKTRFVSASTTDLRHHDDLHHQEEVSCPYNYSQLSSELQAAAERMRRKRSPSLPPIYNRTAPTCQEEESMRGSNPYGINNHDQEDEGEGETSGYASDSGGTSNERNIEYCYQQRRDKYHQQDNWINENSGYERGTRRYSKHTPWIPTNRRYGTPDSIVSSPPCRLWSSGGSDEVNRMRWGDRGVGVGHLWEPTLHEPDSRLPQVQGSGRGTPGWLERGLSKLNNCDSSISSSTQVLVINHGSPEQTPVSREFSGSCDTISIQSQSECNRTFIRGQNAPLEPEVLLERERKRQKALEHQNAIRLQLEERERKRKEEKERRIREEREEEDRIIREQEIERKRIEDEQRKVKEREDKEIRKAAAMREALENAEKKAREEKSRASRKHVLESIKDNSSVCTIANSESNSWFDTQSTIECSESKINSIKQKPVQKNDNPTNSHNEVRNNSKIISTIQEEVLKLNDSTQTLNDGQNEAVLIAAETVALPADGLAVMLSNPAEASSHDMIPTSGGGVQLALLMSPSLPQPLMLDNRLLTPSKYRTMGCERGTQTDSELLIRNRRMKEKAERIMRKDRKKSASLERPHRGCKLPLRCRSQSQPIQPRMRLEDRPKWGVNRPGTQYIKQSDKDPYYQRRLRQRLLRVTMTGGGDTGTESDTGSQRRPPNTRGSSDENSRSPSPQHRSYHSNKNNNNKNVYNREGSKSVDRNANNIDNEEDNENEQLDNKIMMRERNYSISTPNKRVQVTSPTQNVNQRLTENGSNRKGIHRINSRISSSDSQYFPIKGSRRLLNRQAELPATIDTGSDEQWSTAHDILSQLTTLRHGLLMKQQEWDSTRSQTPYSESSWNS